MIPAVDKSVSNEIDRRTIADFGAQWTHFRANPGFYGSVDMLEDILQPLSEIVGRCVCEIGSGSGRIVNMLLDAGAGHVIAIEPSQAERILRLNTAARAERITYLRATGDQLPLAPPLDIVVSIGVLHHVLDPDPILARAWQALKPGGRIAVWLYAWEGNELYLRFALPLRALTRRMPDAGLRALTHLLTPALFGYAPFPAPGHRAREPDSALCPSSSRAGQRGCEKLPPRQLDARVFGKERRRDVEKPCRRVHYVQVVAARRALRRSSDRRRQLPREPLHPRECG